MIPKAFIQEWKRTAPWEDDSQVEQDLVLSRCLVELYNCPAVKDSIAFRGGTALQKLFLPKPSRYSEDIDLVQIKKEPIGEVLTQIRGRIDPILGKAQFTQKQGRVTLVYKFQSEDTPPKAMKLKIEINNEEHFHVYDLQKLKFVVNSKWWSGSSEILTYSLSELMGTKLRALYQRKKGRDLFDLFWVIQNIKGFSPKDTITAFDKYIQHEGLKISRAEFEQNIHEKKANGAFGSDIAPLLTSADAKSFDLKTAFEAVETEIISKLAGNPWAGHSKKKK